MLKLLLLGGSQQQITAIEKARSMGFYTVLCDYLPDNPGKFTADKYYCISTTDEKSVLDVAKKENVDGVLAYASDPAAPAAAYVSEKLGLFTNPYESVKILCSKDKFRSFLKENDFCVPRAKGYSQLFEAKREINEFNMPVIVKPVDSSGSKGVTVIESPCDIEKSFIYAMGFSRSGRVIVEEYIKKAHDYLIGGDFFVMGGEIKFWGLLNCHRDEDVNPLMPSGKSWPLKIENKQTETIKKELSRLIGLLNIKGGAFNIEMVFDRRGDLYIVDIGPRNGGNYIPDFLELVTGVDTVAASCSMAAGDFNINLDFEKKDVYYSTYNIHASQNGILKSISFDHELERKIVRKHMMKLAGDSVEFFDASNKALGVIFLKHDSMDDMIDTMKNIEKLIHIELTEEVP